MAYYAYKELCETLQAAGMIDSFGSPVDKEKYGNEVELDYDGNIHEMASDLIMELWDKVKSLEEELRDE